MKRFAVAFYDLDHDELKVEILTGTTWRHAIVAHSMSPWLAAEPLVEDEGDDADEGNDDTELPQELALARSEANEYSLAFYLVEIID